MKTFFLVLSVNNRKRVRRGNLGLATMLMLFLFAGFVSFDVESAARSDMQNVNPGFNSDHVLALSVTLSKENMA